MEIRMSILNQGLEKEYEIQTMARKRKGVSDEVLENVYDLLLASLKEKNKNNGDLVLPLTVCALNRKKRGAI